MGLDLLMVTEEQAAIIQEGEADVKEMASWHSTYTGVEYVKCEFVRKVVEFLDQLERPATNEEKKGLSNTVLDLSKRVRACSSSEFTIDMKNVNDLQKFISDHKKEVHPVVKGLLLFIDHSGCEGKHSHADATAIGKALELVCSQSRGPEENLDRFFLHLLELRDFFALVDKNPNAIVLYA